MKTKSYVAGFTLVELMITVGIIGILAGIAIPAYHGYISTSASGTADYNAHELASFEDNYFYENSAFLAGTYDPPGTDTLTAALGWTPSGDKGLYKYVVTAGATGITNSYVITVTYKSDPTITATVTKP